MPILTSRQLLITLLNMGLRIQSQTKKKKKLGITKRQAFVIEDPLMLLTDNEKN